MIKLAKVRYVLSKFNCQACGCDIIVHLCYIKHYLGYSNCYINQNSSLFNLKYKCNLTYEAVYAINHLKHRQTFFGLFVVERIITLLILQNLIHRLFRWIVSNEYKHEIDLMRSHVLNVSFKKFD